MPFVVGERLTVAFEVAGAQTMAFSKWLLGIRSMVRHVIALTLLAVSAPAMAQEKPRKQADPNRVICRTQEVIGSRLNTERRCMTAMQWSQLAREQRDTVERAQRLEGRGN